MSNGTFYLEGPLLHSRYGCDQSNGPFNNYVDKGEGGQKMSVFVHAQGIKTVHSGAIKK